MIRAAVFVPLGVSDEERYATEGLECVKHRGYEYAGTYRQPHYVDRLLAEGVAQVVVFARARHWDPDCGWPAEFCDEPTRLILNDVQQRFVPRGDGGFAERFLERRRIAQHRSS